MTHSFNTVIARKYGIEEAIILHDIYYWCLQNKKRNVNGNVSNVDGKFRYWTFNSVRAFEEIYDYMNAPKIKRVLHHLLEENLIIVDKFNKKNYDRTNWYSVTEKGEMEMLTADENGETRLYSDNGSNENCDDFDECSNENEQINESKMNCSIGSICTNRLDTSGQPIPTQTTSQTTSHTSSSKKKEQKQTFPQDYYNQCYQTYRECFEELTSRHLVSGTYYAPIKICNTRLKHWFETFGLEKTIQGIRNASQDEFCRTKLNYSLSKILSEGVFPDRVNNTQSSGSKSNGKTSAIKRLGEQDYSKGW